ncbi:MAG: TIGR04211 family SH3 domain-containing protein [Desulfobacterales bacterium]|nr:TIGR04211 family SH3 domain-containing protein [Desulfobacterales bacterium]
MRRFQFIIPAILGICLIGQTSWAEKAYVTDSFRISLRRGPSIENKILKFLPSGLPVDISESQDGWSRVQLSESRGGYMQGWVLSRYLVTRLPWKVQTESLKKENARLKERLSRIKREHMEADGQHQQLVETVQTLTKKNKSLKSYQRSKWLSVGALVLFGGLLIGLVLGGQRKKRKSSYIIG